MKRLVDWASIRNAYINGNGACTLAAEYHVHADTITRKAAKDNLGLTCQAEVAMTVARQPVMVLLTPAQTLRMEQTLVAEFAADYTCQTEEAAAK